MSPSASHPKPAQLLPATSRCFEYIEKCSPATSNLDLLTYGWYRISPHGASGALGHLDEECLLFCVRGGAEVKMGDADYRLEHYDTLYIPRGTTYHLVNPGDAAALIIVCRAPAHTTHSPYHSRWGDVSQNDARIRRLDGKDVYLMFDVTESADRLMAGYTIYRPRTRAWPPHNHTDQEEVYIFTEGRGAMEVYPDEAHKWFVHSVGPLDAATIPLLNYHPVFSHETELHFIWCLAGKRYWIGDRHQEFMDASVDSITTGEIDEQ